LNCLSALFQRSLKVKEFFNNKYTQGEFELGSNSICYSCPSNIALIKYWGKKETQLPRNPSLSFSLEDARTTTKLKYSKRGRPWDDSPDLKFYFEGSQNQSFAMKVSGFITKASEYLPFLRWLDFEFDSSNSFPHSSGMASSASAMSAIALIFVDIENQLFNLDQNQDVIRKKASALARIGSGSACRSLLPHFSVWGETPEYEGSSDLFAIDIDKQVHQDFMDICDSVVIVSSQVKSVSSSHGHKLMDQHPFAENRYLQARENLSKLKGHLKKGDWVGFGELIELEALTLHGLMMSSSPSYTLLRPLSLEIIEELKNFRTKTNCDIYFTLDAGPNIHLIYPHKEKENLLVFLRSLNLSCDVHHDHLGSGPKKLVVTNG
jgi:diphosphomevalonate decarboxylase